MIIDIIFINVALWSLLMGGTNSCRTYIYKFLSLVIALTIAVVYNGNITLINQNKVINSIANMENIVPVYEGYKRDYLMTKDFIEELPVTTGIQKKVLKKYYSDNIDYVSREIIRVSAEVITKVMEVLLLFSIVLIFLNIVGKIIFKEREKGEKTVNKGVNAIVNLLVNMTAISVFIVLINLMANFLLLELPKIDLKCSISKSIIMGIVDSLLKLI